MALRIFCLNASFCLMILDTIDRLSLIHSNFCVNKKKYLKSLSDCLRTLDILFALRFGYMKLKI